MITGYPFSTPVRGQWVEKRSHSTQFIQETPDLPPLCHGLRSIARKNLGHPIAEPVEDHVDAPTSSSSRPVSTLTPGPMVDDTDSERTNLPFAAAGR